MHYIAYILEISLYISFHPLFPNVCVCEQALMIGDDLVNDVGGAQQVGMKGLQVRTGKYR